MPLTELWNDSGILADKRVRNLDRSTLLELVRSGPVRFVVADPGLSIRAAREGEIAVVRREASPV